MASRIYRIQKGDTLKSIAKLHNISEEEMLYYHNNNCGITQQINNNHIPIHLRFINMQPLDENEEYIESSKIEEGINARYRCETSNVILVDGKPNFSAQVKTEYLCGLVEANDVKTFTIELKDRGRHLPSYFLYLVSH